MTEIAITRSSDRRTYLILERDVVVARDVMEALNDQDPRAHILSARSLDDALERTERLPRITAAFLATSPNQVRASGLGARIEALGGRVILFDGPAHATIGWDHIDRPFTSEVIQAAARKAWCYTPPPEARTG